jgi:hypothetical protein
MLSFLDFSKVVRTVHSLEIISVGSCDLKFLMRVIEGFHHFFSLGKVSLVVCTGSHLIVSCGSLLFDLVFSRLPFLLFIILEIFKNVE